jgi:hypothetical protein
LKQNLRVIHNNYLVKKNIALLIKPNQSLKHCLKIEIEIFILKVGWWSGWMGVKPGLGASYGHSYTSECVIVSHCNLLDIKNKRIFESCEN